MVGTNVGSISICGVCGRGDVEGEVETSEPESELSLQCDGSELVGAAFVCARWWLRGEAGSDTVWCERVTKRAGRTMEMIASWWERRSDSCRESS